MPTPEAESTRILDVTHRLIQIIERTGGYLRSEDQRALHDARTIVDRCISVTSERDARQAAILAWAKLAFSEDQATSLPQRGIRLLEEAIEAYQACGGQRDAADRLVGYVFSREPGELGQELGGVAVTTLCLAAAAGLSADRCEQHEVRRVLSRPIEEFTRRNQAKNDAGFLVVRTVDPARGE
jgi:hypothetical protein